MEWMFSLMVTVRYVLETHSSRKLFEIDQEMAFDSFLLITGVGINQSPFDSMLTWLSVNL